MSISFTLIGATPDSYSTFIKQLRDRLTFRTTSQGIPVLPSSRQVGNNDRFIYVNLTNYDGVTVTIGIDVVNVYVMGYEQGGQNYLLRTLPDEAAPVELLFPNTRAAGVLPFQGDYHSLGQYARNMPNEQPNPRDQQSIDQRRNDMRRNIRLGPRDLHFAIDMLGRAASSQAKPIIVIIQMVSEAARYPYIERQVRKSISTGDSFLPDPLMLTLENNWSTLSRQNMRSGDSFGQDMEIALLLHDRGDDRGTDQGIDPKNCTAGPSVPGRGGWRGKKPHDEL